MLFSVRYRLSSSLLSLLCLAPVASHATVVHRVHIEGEGHPTVIFENGLGDTLKVWEQVQSAIADDCTQTLSYNRAGYEGSDPARNARDAETIVAELRSELRSRGIEPPYVLVGHSLGGLYMQYFARQYADEIAGLVLVDSTHWNQRLLLGAPTSRADRRGRVVLFMDFTARRELNDSASAGEQVHTSPAPGGFPTIVLSSTGVFLGETPARRAEAARLQEDIAASFPGARHVRVEGSGHYIQRERPDVVIESVRTLAGCQRPTTDPPSQEDLTRSSPR
ncbi:MAG: alpha/beta hydrolase [Xanthomonadaceae bacterium]|nr:alpha/beta hydrolase [Xanthomonadaceae bacterium]